PAKSAAALKPAKSPFAAPSPGCTQAPKPLFGAPPPQDDEEAPCGPR
ncbi:MAG TPA: serine/threonine protein kinase, partial [Elusimicrobia bacterium]|nr:serine/threonine protein kinase [Elusimicrobiota bacterium]